MIILPDLIIQVSCISSALIVTYIHVGRCIEKMKIQGLYNRYVGPNVLYVCLSNVVFERLNGFLTKM